MGSEMCIRDSYKDIMGFNSVLELPCNININCPIGAPWVEQKRSVSRITFNQGGSGFLCSGALMNNTQNDSCLLYTSDAADDLLCVDLGGRRIITKKNS